jgi:hypothetical protein
VASDGFRPAFSLIKGGRDARRGNTASEPVQATLFMGPKSTSAVFVSFAHLKENDFVKALEYARPRFIFELRSCPRFDLGQLNRRSAFQRFEETKSQYFDLAVTGPDLMERLRDHLRQVGPALTGPVMFFVDGSTQGLEFEIAQALKEVSAQSWDVSDVPENISG